MNGRYARQSGCFRGKRPREITTQKLFNRAIEHFQSIYNDSVERHERETFASRAVFEKQCGVDREHFNRAHGSLAKHGKGKDFALVLEQFENEEAKLQREHEEELQRVYPLAFLELDTAAVLSLTLIPRLKSKLDLLERQLTQRRKFTNQHQGDAAARGSHSRDVDPPVDAKESDDKNGADGVPSEVNDAKIGIEKDDVGTLCVGRGAYITGDEPNEVEESDSSALVQVLDTSVEDGKVGTGTGGGFRNHVHRLVSRGLGNILSIPTDVMRAGAADFARIGLLLNTESRRERRNERRKFLRSHMEVCGPEGKTIGKWELKRLLQEGKEDKLKQEEIFAALEAAKTMPEFTGSDMNANIVESMENDGAPRKTAGASTASRETGDTTASETVVKRHTKIVLRGNGSRRDDGVPFTRKDFEWTSLGLDDESIGEGSRMEKLAESYMWPKRTEDRIPHILCGEVIPTYFRVRQYQLDTSSPTTATVQMSATGEDGCPSTLLDDFAEATQLDPVREGMSNGEKGVVTKKSPLVFRIPFRAKSVWLKVDTLGDFIASQVKFFGAATSREI